MPPTRCPRCGFTFAWDGRRCGHCPTPARLRQLWEASANLGEFLSPGRPPPPTRSLLALAGGCLRRVRAELPGSVRVFAEWFERGDRVTLGHATAGLPAATRPAVGHRDPVGGIGRAVQGVVAATLRGYGGDPRPAVALLASSCREADGYHLFPDRELTTFPLPPNLEGYRTAVAEGLSRLDRAGRPHPSWGAEEREVYGHLSRAATAYTQEQRRAVAAEEATQCDIARDVLGYPEAVIRFEPGWRTGTAVALAREMTETRDFSAMPILADALQDAGCDDDEVLAHCRSEKPHFRGCWVVDRVLDARRA